jgi:hypothetical protein
MRRLVLAFVALGLVSGNAQAQQAAPVMSPDVPLNPNDNSGLRKVAAELLFWPQAKRDANFPQMEKLFPGHIVQAGGKVRALPPGKPLAIADVDVDAFMAAQNVAGLIVLKDGKIVLERYARGYGPSGRWTSFSVPPGEDSTVYYMKKLVREAPPGSKWVYKTGETNLVGVLVARATGKPLANYLSEKVWKPFGMEQDGFWMVDPSNHEVGGCCLSVTLRDYARMGQFVLEGGAGVVPSGWFAASTAAHADIGRPGFGYGYQWWTYPGGRFGAQGIFGQSITIDSKSKVVIAISADGAKASDSDYSAMRLAFTEKLFAAAAR